MILIILIFHHNSVLLHWAFSSLHIWWIKLLPMPIRISWVRRFYDFSCGKQCKAEDKISTHGPEVLEQQKTRCWQNQAEGGKLVYQAATLLSANWCLYRRYFPMPCLAVNRSYCLVSFWIQRSLWSVDLKVSLVPFFIRTEHWTQGLHLSFFSH